ncbi:MAG: acyl carrier protein [Gammaproteobacteria bacterium]|nr:acyl carrier protein [Gammaproteobacteria bacterium]
MTQIDRVRRILGDALQLGPRADALREDSRLLGAIPEFDSMAVVSVLTMIEEEFGFTIDDDEMSGELFETLGSLTAFVEAKLQG